jgi:hypothetical protein
MAEYAGQQRVQPSVSLADATFTDLEGYLYCSHDGLPMIEIDYEYVCIGEYLFAHLNNTGVTDLLSEPQLTLVFQNGHTMPLLCPDCGESLHIDDEDLLLNSLNGLAIIGIGWDEDIQTVILHFGTLPEDTEDIEDYIDEVEPLESLEIHLDSIRGITCPHQKDN